MRTLLSSVDLERHLATLNGWTLSDSQISKTYRFVDYYRTMAFVNAVAFIAHQLDHHPDLIVGYNRVVVTYSTHDSGGVTQLDVECAKRVEQLGQV